MNEVYELATVVFRKGPSDTSPMVLHKKGWETGDQAFGPNILALLPQGKIAFTRENNVGIKEGIYKASLEDQGLFIPDGQFSKVIYSNLLVLIADSGKAYQSLTAEAFGNTLKDLRIIARDGAHLIHWMIIQLQNQESFQLGEYTFRNHDGVLEK